MHELKAFFSFLRELKKGNKKKKKFLRGASRYLFVEVGEPIRATKSLKKKKVNKQPWTIKIVTHLISSLKHQFYILIQRSCVDKNIRITVHYYPTVLCRVQKAPETSTNITRSIYIHIYTYNIYIRLQAEILHAEVSNKTSIREIFPH